jgi:hypothetical protein
MDRGVERFCLIAVNVHLLFLSIHDLNKHDCHVSIEVFFRTVRNFEVERSNFPSRVIFSSTSRRSCCISFSEFLAHRKTETCGKSFAGYGAGRA